MISPRAGEPPAQGNSMEQRPGNGAGASFIPILLGMQGSLDKYRLQRYR